MARAGPMNADFRRSLLRTPNSTDSSPDSCISGTVPVTFQVDGKIRMVARSKSSDPKGKVAASVKVEATARAKWSREHHSVAYIPPDVTRANATAFRDFLSPLTQAAGLIGDRLKFRRWREAREAESKQSLERIASIAAENRNQVTAAEPPPLKFLVPFVANASLEEPDSPLITMWAKLLASATDNYDPRHIHFVSVISRLSGRQAEILKNIVARASDSRYLEFGMDDSHYVTEWGIRKYVDELFTGQIPHQFPKGRLTNQRLCRIVEFALRSPVISVSHVSAANEKTGDYFDVNLDHLRIYEDSHEIDYAILEACGLLQKVDTGFFLIAQGNWSIALTYYLLTTLGFALAIDCQMVPSAPGWRGRLDG